MRRLPFVKMSACGNDFCLIDNRDGRFPNPPGPVVKHICPRRISLGADGVILIEGSQTTFFRMRYYNSDGGEVEMCGNGARCAARFAYLNGIAPLHMSFETGAGMIHAEVQEGKVRIGMGDAVLDQNGGRISIPDIIPHGEVYHIVIGVPHVVVFVDDLEETDVIGLGRRIRYHDAFAPKGTNANFIRVVGPQLIDIRTYERGVEDETLACGTGSTAAALIACSTGSVFPPVGIMTRSGCPLRVGFERDGDLFRQIWLEGEARVIGNGDLWLDEIEKGFE